MLRKEIKLFKKNISIIYSYMSTRYRISSNSYKGENKVLGGKR